MNFFTSPIRILALVISFSSCLAFGQDSGGSASSSSDGGSSSSTGFGGGGGSPLPAALPANYKLNVTDMITIVVFEEPELGKTQRIPSNGRIRVPLLGEIDLLGLTIREAEYKLQNALVDARLLRDPQVYITVSGYVAREFSVFGQIGGQGQIPFPLEKDSMDIVEAIARAGGFTGIARGSDVRITRKKEDGTMEYLSVDVEAMIEDQEEGNDRDEYLVYPGDILYVPERLF